MTYTVRDARGRPLARLAKNWLYNAIRKRWYVYAPDGRLLFLAKEDSAILSLLRRFLGPLFGLLRTNFFFLPAGTVHVLSGFQTTFASPHPHAWGLTPATRSPVFRPFAPGTW